MQKIESFKYKTEIETRFVDFDMMGHANNASYLTYMEMARSRYWKHAIQWNLNTTGVVIAQACVDYISPILPSDKISIYVRTSRIGNSSFDLEYLLVKMESGQESPCAKGKTICVAFDYQQKKAITIPETAKNNMIRFEQLE